MSIIGLANILDNLIALPMFTKIFTEGYPCSRVM
jgi:hypothetical protein